MHIQGWYKTPDWVSHNGFNDDVLWAVILMVRAFQTLNPWIWPRKVMFTPGPPKGFLLIAPLAVDVKGVH